MGRAILAIVIGATLGSIIATCCLLITVGGIQSPEDTRTATALVVMSLVLTLPGGSMVYSLHALLYDRGAAPLAASIVALVFGTVAGAAMLALFLSLDSAKMGALYGFTTSACVLVARLILITSRAKRPTPARR